MNNMSSLLRSAVAGLPKCNQPGCKFTATQLCETNEMGYDVSYVYCDRHAESYMVDLSYADAVRQVSEAE